MDQTYLAFPFGIDGRGRTGTTMRTRICGR